MTGNGITPLEAQPQPFTAGMLQSAKKRKRSSSPSHNAPRRKRSKSPSNLTPAGNEAPPTTSEASPNASKRPRSKSPEAPPRKQKRPGRGARISEADRERIRQRQLERDKETAQIVQTQTIHEAVRQHYNAVPERGREWRKTDSRIKGLRSFNNWVKSTLIQKFSMSEDFTPGALERGDSGFDEGPPTKGLLVLDIGCGKGGDLMKWQKAPQFVDLYIGLDPAEVSIEQANERYRQMSSRGGGHGGRGGRGGRGGYSRAPRLFEGHFYVQDCFNESLGKIPLVRNVGFDETPGPTRFGGFDVVSMMFCMHYAFETEEKARIMLKNVAGALKKGGRLIGCIPNSDVLSEHVREFNERIAAQKQSGKSQDNKKPEDGEEVEEGEAEDTASWGNDIYKVRFPGKTPADGIFRPPFGWKYNFHLDEAVESVPEYVVPWEAFRAIAEDYNLEMQYHKTFDEVWQADKDDPILGPLSENMGVRERGSGRLLVEPQEMEAASFYVAFCFYKV